MNIIKKLFEHFCLCNNCIMLRADLKHLKQIEKSTLKHYKNNRRSFNC